MNHFLWIIPVVGAAIGWLANSLLLHFLFRPTQPRQILGFSLQGLLPKKRPALAQKLGKAVKNNMVNFDEMGAKLSHPSNMEKISPMVELHIDKFLKEKLTAEMPMISLLISDKTIGKLKSVLMAEINTLFPQLIQQYIGNLSQQIDLEKIVAEKIMIFPDEQVESMIKTLLAKELGRIKLWGAIIGFIIGLVMLLITGLLH